MKKPFLVLACVLALTAFAATMALALPIVGCVATQNVCKGTNRAELIVGIRGNETILARGGGDRVRGADTPETIKGGPGRDTILGRGGRDTIRAVDDGTRDTVRCGPGRDRAHADWEDRLFGCEDEIRYDTF